MEPKSLTKEDEGKNIIEETQREEISVDNYFQAKTIDELEWEATMNMIKNQKDDRASSSYDPFGNYDFAIQFEDDRLDGIELLSRVMLDEDYPARVTNEEVKTLLANSEPKDTQLQANITISVQVRSSTPAESNIESLIIDEEVIVPCEPPQNVAPLRACVDNIVINFELLKQWIILEDERNDGRVDKTFIHLPTKKRFRSYIGVEDFIYGKPDPKVFKDESGSSTPPASERRKRRKGVNWEFAKTEEIAIYGRDNPKEYAIHEIRFFLTDDMKSLVEKHKIARKRKMDKNTSPQKERSDNTKEEKDQDPVHEEAKAEEPMKYTNEKLEEAAANQEIQQADDENNMKLELEAKYPKITWEQKKAVEEWHAECWANLLSGTSISTKEKKRKTRTDEEEEGKQEVTKGEK